MIETFVKIYITSSGHRLETHLMKQEKVNGWHGIGYNRKGEPDHQAVKHRNTVATKQGSLADLHKTAR